MLDILIYTKFDSLKSISIHDGVIKWKHFPRYWPFMRGIHRSLVNSLHKGQERGTLMFSLICTQINGWVNNREAGDLRCHRTNYDVIVMKWCYIDTYSLYKTLYFDSVLPTYVVLVLQTIDNVVNLMNAQNFIIIWVACLVLWQFPQCMKNHAYICTVHRNLKKVPKFGSFTCLAFTMMKLLNYYLYGSLKLSSKLFLSHLIRFRIWVIIDFIENMIFTIKITSLLHILAFISCANSVTPESLWPHKDIAIHVTHKIHA